MKEFMSTIYCIRGNMMKTTLMFLKAPVCDNFKFGGQINHDISILSHVNLISLGVENINSCWWGSTSSLPKHLLPPNS